MPENLSVEMPEKNIEYDTKFKSYSKICTAIAFTLSILLLLVDGDYKKWQLMLIVLSTSYFTTICVFSCYLLSRFFDNEKSYRDTAFAKIFRKKYIPQIIGWMIGASTASGFEEFIFALLESS